MLMVHHSFWTRSRPTFDVRSLIISICFCWWLGAHVSWHRATSVIVSLMSWILLLVWWILSHNISTSMMLRCLNSCRSSIVFVWLCQMVFGRWSQPTSRLDRLLLKFTSVFVWVNHYIADHLFYNHLLFSELLSVILSRYIHDVRCTPTLPFQFLCRWTFNTTATVIISVLVVTVVAIDESSRITRLCLPFICFDGAVNAGMILFMYRLFYHSAWFSIGGNDCDIRYLHGNELDLLWIFLFHDLIWTIKGMHLLLLLKPQGCAWEKIWTTVGHLCIIMVIIVSHAIVYFIGSRLLVLFLLDRRRRRCWFPQIYPSDDFVLFFVRVGRYLLCCDVLFWLGSGYSSASV